MASVITYVALLRAINVGGRNSIAMPALRAMCVELGLVEPRTLLQSGNLVFRSAIARTKLAPLLEGQTVKRFAVTVDYVIRSAEEWARLIEANPFPDAAVHDPAHLVVMCCKTVPGALSLAALDAAIRGRESVRAAGANVYITYPDGIGDSRLTNAVIEKHLATNGTARNWNTVRKLAALTAT